MHKYFNIFESLAVGDGSFEPHTECEPTQHVPGTSAKVEELRRRNALGQTLFHREDARDFESVEGEHAEVAATFRAPFGYRQRRLEA